MGCCLSTNAVNHHRPSKPAASQSPPPSFEEETVKEVLSETPIAPKPHPPEKHIEIPQPEEHSGVEIRENASEISEMCSYSESFSAATTATTMTTAADPKKDGIDEDDGEVTQKVKMKSPPAKKLVRKRPVGSSGEFPVRKERGARPMARRQMAHSPERKRQSPARTTTNTPRYRNVGPASEGRKEVMARRSRSPAVRGEARQRRKVMEESPGGKSGELLSVKAVESEEKSTVEKADDGGVSPLPEADVQASESLENPLVSLECFIFL
ncbi:hypothetical protein L1987_32249 [Smallanthus sonchifolius]|uniref:Uncharacterized protein n=1 Tax=Smallanthus sonchifolius TaxID=185202 RepID=A0ACB9I7X0_9ASTR|nr:hypothetical protein L1987_32249 [Smallanthus sonchifolius]